MSRLAEILGLDRRELFFLANPQAVELLKASEADSKRPAWEVFSKDERIRRVHNIASDEMELLSTVAEMGEISSTRHFIYILNVVRHALQR